MIKLFLRSTSKLSVSFYVFLTIFIFILPLNLLFINSSKRASQALLNQVTYNLNTTSSIYANNISSRTERTTLFINAIMSNNSYMKTVYHQTGDEHYKICKFILLKTLIDSSTQQNEGDIYFIYSPKLSDLSIVKRASLSSIQTLELQNYLKKNMKDTFSSKWKLVTIDKKQYLVRSSKNNNLYVGSLIRLTPFIDDLKASADYSITKAFFTAEKTTDSATRTWLTASTSIQNSNALLICQTKKEEALSELSFFQRYTYLISIVYLILIPLLYFTLVLLLLRPLSVIREALLQMTSGNQNYRIPNIHCALEFKKINHSFNHMADSIHTLTIHNYEHEMARQQVEMDNLQLTIRPHFLQNTFGMLYTLCQMEKNEQLGHFILYLSDYFRYIYTGVHQLSSFASELSIIKGYLEIADVQHPHRFTTSYELPQEYTSIMIPPLLIHNFIENIISHALTTDRLVRIHLKVTKNEDYAFFEITDDGIGIPPDYVSQINSGKPIEDQDRIHVGMYNSWQRLDKIYGNQAVMEVTSVLSEGTTISLKIPLTSGGYKNEFTDCK